MEKHVQGGISYTISPVHTNEQFAKFAVKLAELGCDSICIKDMAGLITPQNAYDLIREIKKEVRLSGKSPHALHQWHGSDELLLCLSGGCGHP